MSTATSTNDREPTRHLRQVEVERSDATSESQRLTTDQPIPVTFRCAGLNDAEQVVSFFLEPDPTSGLIPRNSEELRAHVEAGEVFVTEANGRMVASIICSWLRGDAQDHLFGSLGVPARIARQLIPTYCLWVGGLRVVRGMRNKGCATTDGSTFPSGGHHCHDLVVPNTTLWELLRCVLRHHS